MGGGFGGDEEKQGMILVDTSVWIDFFKGVGSEYQQRLHDLIAEGRDICLADVILTEILQGIKRDKEFEDVRSYLLEFRCYSGRGVDTFVKAAQIYRACSKKGRTVRKTIDCIIASIAIENDLEIFHNDMDFDLISECTDLRILKF